jgi:GTPase
MVVVADLPQTKLAISEFWCMVNILHSPTTIRTGYQPFVHIDQVRQSVNMLEIRKIKKPNTVITTNSDHDDNPEENNILRTGDKAYIKLKFVSKPEYVKSGMKLIFREGKVKAVGKIIDQQEVQ